MRRLICSRVLASPVRDYHGNGPWSTADFLVRRCLHSSQPVVVGRQNEVAAQVPNGIGKPYDIKIIYPPKPENQGPVILALGSGIRPERDIDHSYAISVGANAVTICPAYQLSHDWRYPAPVHMVLKILDWASRNISASSNRNDQTLKPKFGVCGELVGASLAAMAGLTECRSPWPDIQAVAIGNPILDWTDLFPARRAMQLADLRAIGRKEEPRPGTADGDGERDLSLGHLLAQRRKIFNKAEDFFDPFASPLLFFRTPCFDLPSVPIPYASPMEDSDIVTWSDPEDTPIRRKRKYHRSYPPLSSELILPKMRISVGADFVLKHQTFEFLDQLEKSVARDARRGLGPGQENDESRFWAEELVGLGQWDEHHALEMGSWLGQVIREG